MSHPVIPAPVRFDRGAGQFALRPDTPIACTAPEVAPVVERFCAEIWRRTGLRVAPMAGRPGPGEPSVQVELAIGGECAALPAPLGLSPAGGGPADERYSLSDRGRSGRPASRGTGRRRARPDHAPPAGRDPGPRRRGGLAAGRADPRRAPVRLARPFARPGPQVLHARRGPPGDRPDRALQAQRPAPAPDRRPGLAPAGRKPLPRRRRHVVQRRDLRTLAAYAADRFVTVVPEVDTPGHVSALMRIHPELDTGRNDGWLDPELPATFAVVQDVLTEVAGIFPGPLPAHRRRRAVGDAP